MGRKINLNLIIGLGLVILGGLFLLDNFDVIYFDVPYWVFRWQSILIIIGLVMLVNSDNKSAGSILIAIGLFFWFPKFWPLLLVALGVYILYKRKDPAGMNDKVSSDSTDGGNQNDYLNDVSIFGGGKKMINSENFKGGKITSIFGGSEIDLYDSKLAKGVNVLDVFALFGGSDITAPSDWNINVDVISIFGGFEDKRRKDPDQVPDPERKLVIKGLVLFGGGNVKS